MPAIQENRLLAISSPLGDDVLLLQSISVEEPLGRLFSIEAELSSEDADVDFKKIMGGNVTIRLEMQNGETRYFNGIVSRFVQMSNKGGYARYHATVVPWLWLLTRTSDCRIFQEMTVPDIIEKVFRDHGLTHYQLNLSETYATREYCVQYRETDFNFVNRLMEQEGIYYFFKHENGKHTMVLADAPSAHSPGNGITEAEFLILEKGAEGRSGITDWRVECEVQPGTYSLSDFDFKLPKKSLVALSSKSRGHSSADYAMFDFPGEYVENGEGDRLARVRLEEYQSQHEVCSGQANLRGLSTGCTFKLTRHPRRDQEREYLLTGVKLHADAGELAAGGEGGGEFFSCSIRAIPVDQPFRSVQATPKPLIQGPQTAIVVGPSSEEIHTDEFGRVKVRFHWDRAGAGDETSSCWIRVAQVWAGKQWGAMFIPRKDQEVIVEFLEGDPDRPIITGRVYNGEAKPPYELPAEKTKSTLRSNSSKGGGGFNEFRMEDKKGEEQVFIHAEKDYELRVKNDAYHNVTRDFHLIIENDQMVEIKGARSETVEKDHSEKITGDRNLTVEGKQATAITGDVSLTVDGKMEEEIKGNHTEKTTGNYELKAAQITLEADSKIEIKVGGSKITMDPAKIELKSTMITIKGDAQVEVSGANAKVEGSGMLTLKGGVVMIN